MRLRISDGSRELEQLNFEVRLEEFIFKSASRLSMTILDPPIATLVANFQSRVLNPDAFITTRRDRLYWEAPSDRSSPISRPTGAADLIDAKTSLAAHTRVIAAGRSLFTPPFKFRFGWNF